MTRAAVSIRARADADFDAAIDHYLREAGEAVALRFIDAVEAAHRLIAENPRIGSTRLADQVSIPGLRSIRTGGFPYLVVYVEMDGALDVLRLLHAQRDLPKLLEPDQV